jgi:Terminase RNaseH-like domain
MPHVTNASWDDVPHISPNERTELLRSIPPHQVDARTRGVPMLGSGAIYPIDERLVACDPRPIPAYWPKGYGFDVGWNWTAAVFMAHDRDTDILYVYDAYKHSKAEPAIHAAAIRSRGAWLQGEIDPAARGRAQSDGRQLLAMYEELGLLLRPADNTVEAGIATVWQRLSTGRLRVFKHLSDWFGEFRIYRRDETGKVVKTNDHLMDATRYRVMDTASMISESDALYGGHRRTQYEGDTK